MPKYTEDEYDDMECDQKVAAGFDRGFDYDDIKGKIIKKYYELINSISELDIDKGNSEKKKKAFEATKRILHNKVIYLITALIQLRNGSRCIESCAAIKLFFKKGNFDDKIIVKIAKSECEKRKKDTGELYVTKRRNRKVAFPNNWIDFELDDNFKHYLDIITIKKLKQRVLQYLLSEFGCNTHSLRYAFINYMLYKKKIEMSLVAKHVGHTSVNYLVKYTSNKNADGIFDIDD